MVHRGAGQDPPGRANGVYGVDDGKSTLIGRLLYDSKAIFEDQLEAIETLEQQLREDLASQPSTNLS